MKILQVIPVFSPEFGGPVKVVSSISKELAKNHEVVVCTTSASSHTEDNRDFPYEYESDGYKVICFPRILRSTEFNISPMMARYIKRSVDDYDIIHVHSWRQFQDMVVHHYAKKRGVPYVLQAHGSIPRIDNMKSEKWFYDMLFGYRVLKDASKLISLNSTESKQYSKMGVPREKIETVPNGVELSDYGKLPQRGFFKKKYSINPEEKIVLYLGRLHKTKGLRLLVEAFSLVAEKMSSTRLVIVGPDDGYLGELLALSSRLGITHRILLTGFVEKNDKMAALVDSEVLVTPQFLGFPVTFLEACLASCPIVTTFNDLDWIHDKVGLVVVGESPIALATAISRLLQEESLQKKFRAICKKTIKGFDISIVTQRLESIYGQAISGKDN